MVSCYQPYQLQPMITPSQTQPSGREVTLYFSWGKKSDDVLINKIFPLVSRCSAHSQAV